MDGDPGVVPDRGDQLVMPDVDGHDVVRAAAQQHVGESAGGGTGVEAPLAGDLDGGKGVQRSGELVPGAADVVVFAGGRYLEACVVADLEGGLGQHFPVGADFAFGDEAGGMGAGPRQPAADEGLVKPAHSRRLPVRCW